MEQIAISGSGLSARIKADGAELCSLQDESGREFVWQALPAWPRHAPVLFPIVGRLAGDTLRQGGASFKLTQHGFARDRRFTLALKAADHCTWVLEDDADTRARYPFPFRFEVSYTITGRELHIGFDVDNPGEAPLPASMGAHPAFSWPLPGAASKAGHVLTFEHPEPAPTRRVAGGLLQPQTEPSPLEGRVLRLDDRLFARDAVIFTQLASRWVRMEAQGAAGLEVGWDGFAQLGLWMKPGAEFLCIEPWRGYASPEGWDGDFAGKPGVFHVPPGGRISATHRVRLLP